MGIQDIQNITITTYGKMRICTRRSEERYLQKWEQETRIWFSKSSWFAVHERGHWTPTRGRKPTPDEWRAAQRNDIGRKFTMTSFHVPEQMTGLVSGHKGWTWTMKFPTVERANLLLVGANGTMTITWEKSLQQKNEYQKWLFEKADVIRSDYLKRWL